MLLTLHGLKKGVPETAHWHENKTTLASKYSKYLQAIKAKYPVVKCQTFKNKILLCDLAWYLQVSWVCVAAAQRFSIEGYCHNQGSGVSGFIAETGANKAELVHTRNKASQQLKLSGEKSQRGLSNFPQQLPWLFRLLLFNTKGS